MSRSLSWCAVALVTACGAGETRVDPGDLELRDLLACQPNIGLDGDQPVALQHVAATGVLDAVGKDALGYSDR